MREPLGTAEMDDDFVLVFFLQHPASGRLGWLQMKEVADEEEEEEEEEGPRTRS